jgi:AraC-like DNA-binding protein
MIITLKPTSSDFKPRDPDSLDPLGRCSHIIHTTGQRHYYSEWAGPLSIKSFFNGQAFYDAGAGHYAVDDGAYLILNESQPYSITIDSHTRVASFCLFFESGLAEAVRRDLTAGTTQLLDDPHRPASRQIEFVQKLYPHDDTLSPALFKLRTSLTQRKNEHGWIKEQLHEIVERLLKVHGVVLKEMERLPAVRAATREELYRRLYRARDFAAAYFEQPVTLDDMAGAACLSPNHFLRTFKQVFGQSPHQYLTDLRLEQARRLLVKTELSISNIAIAVGFESHGSFSRLFRGRVGISPQIYRRQKGDFG